MPNKNYIRGRAFEYRVKKDLEDKGYIVVRSAGSKSPFDLVAISLKVQYPDVILVQCKYGAKITKKERENLHKISKKIPKNIYVATAWAKPNKPIVYYDSDNEVIIW
jgi:Holliday junction resolvase